MTMLSRIFGLFRDIFITAVFGASLLNSAFTAAFTLPNLFRRLLGEGALTAALMPNLSEEMEEKGRDAVFQLVNKTLSWLFVTCLVLVGGAFFAFDWIEGISVSENWIVGARLSKLVFPYVLPVCLAAVVSAVLNMLGRFAIPAMTAVWLNCSMMLFLGLGGWLWGDDSAQRMKFLCVGVFTGGLLQFLVPAFALVKEGWKPRLDFAVSARLKGVLFLALPGIYGMASHQINVMISRFLALEFNESGATLIYLANRLVELPLGVFTIAISTVVFPAMSQSIAQGRIEDFGLTFRKGISLSMMLTMPAAAGLIFLAPEIIAGLFERGEFTSSNSEALSPILIICAIGMPFYAFVSLETRAFYALKDAKTPVWGSSIALVINLILSLTLLRLLDRIEALVIASNIAMVVQSIFMHVRLRKKGISVQLSKVVPSIAKYLIGSFLIAGSIILVERLLGNSLENAEQRPYLILAVSIPVGVIVYFAFLKIMRVSEVNEILSMFDKKNRSDST